LWTILLILIWPGLAMAQAPVEQGPPNAGFSPAFVNQTRAPALEPTAVHVEVFATGLANPWGIAPLPDDRWLVTERPGRMRIIDAEGNISGPITGLPDVDARRQGGLLDVEVGPDFARDRIVYWTYAKRVRGGTVTAAARGRLSEDGRAMTDVADIFVQDPPSRTPMHYGSRILFDDAGHVFITTGEHSSDADRIKAQDLSTTYGKVIRLNPDGTNPADNPFVSVEGDDAIWSYGHRNMQGAALDAQGNLWTIEHGPAGGDELNREQPGANYGWPLVSYGVNYDGSPVGTGAPRAAGTEEPVYYWDPVIAPGGMLFYRGAAFGAWEGDAVIGSLNPGGLVRLRMAQGRVAGEERLLGEVGRVRDVEEMPDGTLLILIDSPDGKVLRVFPVGG
jgi:glucose/arabinose dehydrogenase